jgi:hypothetical protein
MIIHAVVHSITTYCSSYQNILGKNGCSTWSPAGKNLKFHLKNATREIQFGDEGTLPPSLTIYLSKLVWLEQISKCPEKRWVSTKNNIRVEGTRGVGRPRTGTIWYQSVAHILSNIKHNLKIEFSEQAAHDNPQ